MSGLDSNYIIASGLQELFVDKVTGLPLAGGIVTFYKDQARTILKPIYELIGGPGSYSYFPLPNPLTLSSVGTIQDGSGNDVVPYYYPYDTAGNVELYYITVVSAGGVPQWTRQAWPNTVAAITPQDIIQENFIPNGQLLVHSITPAVGTKVVGTITADVTAIAQGGWFYTRSAGSTATDVITFPAFGSPISNPSSNPKYALRFACSVVNPGDTYKYVGITFNDVNKFSSSSTSPQYYTLSFAAKSNTSPVGIPILLYRYFGVSGSPDVYLPAIGTANFTTSYTTFNFSFTYDNTGKTVGTGDTVSLVLSIPPTYPIDISATDFVLVVGKNVNVTQFPIEPNYIFQNQSIVAAVPDPMGFDLYLPTVLTPTGLTYDRSVVGQIVPCVYPTVVGRPGWLLCDGTTYYNQNYSTDGIPYQRLGSILWNSTLHLPAFGTGATFDTASLRTPANLLTLSRNNPGTSTVAANGTSSPGFTFSQIISGSVTPGYWSGVFGPGTTFYGLCKTYGVCTIASIGTTGWTFYPYRTGSAIVQELFAFTVTTSGSVLQSQYITFYDTTASYYIWFTVDGVGTDPAPALPGTVHGIKVALLSTYTINDIAQIVSQAMSGFAVDIITTVAATTPILAGSWFSIYNQANAQFVYYFTIGGVGSVPTVPGAMITPIDITGTETATQIATKVLDAINQTAWATPDLRGDFIRFWDNGSGNELSAPNRGNWLNGPMGDNIGSFEFDEYMIHRHGFSVPTYTSLKDSSGSNHVWNDVSTLDSSTLDSGGQETRPVNFSVNAVIKY